MTRIIPLQSRRSGLGLVFAFFLLVTAGCANSPKVTITPSFKIVASQEIMPILPFASTLVPESFSESVFNNFVDILNDNQSKTRIKWFSIIKENIQDVERQIPPDNIYITGEIWSYIENSGCCSTELRVKARIRFFEVGSPERIMEILLPMESFFEHDHSTLTVEREKLALRLAQEMAQQVLLALKAPTPPHRSK
jgi:hypothetical protein